MAICFECGTLLHNDDVVDHVCVEADKPQKTKPIKLAKTQG